MARIRTVSRNLTAFLDMLAWAEIGAALLSKSDDGYNVIVGSTPMAPKLFHSYIKHPAEYVKLGSLKITSSAAGRYQILHKYADHYVAQLGLPDFGPISQDKIAIQLIKECKAVQLIEDGKIEEAIRACSSRWASLPGAGYGQHEHKMDELVSHFIAYGGKVTKC